MGTNGFHYMIGRQTLAPCVVIVEVNSSKEDLLGFLRSLGMLVLTQHIIIFKYP